MADTPCPDRGELLAFARGTLSVPLFTRLASHVEACATCQAGLEELDAVADSVLMGLRGVTPEETATVRPVPEVLVQAAQRLGLARAEISETVVLAEATGSRRLGKFELVREL